MCQISPFNFCNVVGGPLCSIWGEDSNENGIAKERTLAKLSRIAGQAWKKLIIFSVTSWFSWCCFALQALNKNVISKEEMAKKSEHLARCDAQDELHWYCWRWYCWLRYEKAVLVDILRTEARARHAKHCQTWSKSLVLQRSHPPRSQPCVNPPTKPQVSGGVFNIRGRDCWDSMGWDDEQYTEILVDTSIGQSDAFFCALLVFKCF